MFKNPQLLNLLFAIPLIALLLLFCLKKKKRDLFKFVSNDMFDKVSNINLRIFSVKNILILICFFLLIIALARPEYGVKTGDKISFDIYSVISLLGIVQGFFLAVLLINIKSGNRRANRILAFYLIVVSLNILSDPYFFSGLFNRYPGFSFIGETYPLIILYGPLLYFYTVHLTLPSFIFRPVHMFHLLPAFIALLVVTHQRLVTGDEELKLFWDSYINDTAYR